jgi:hypothetical protein
MILKRSIPLLIAAIVGFLLIATYFIPKTEQWGADAMEMFIILAAAAMVLGAGNLVLMNLSKISNRSEGWGYATITLVAFFVVLYIGMFKIGAMPTPSSPDNAWTAPIVQEGAPFWWIYQYCLVPLTATMFAMLAFYIASAAFRAFRAKNLEAFLLLLTAFIVLLGQIYAGIWLSDHIFIVAGLPDLASYVATFPQEIQATVDAIGLQVNAASDVLMSSIIVDGVPYASLGTADQALVQQVYDHLHDPWYQFLNGLRFENLTQIIMDVPQNAGNRAIMIGIALGIVSVSLKVLLGVDRSYLGSED